MPVHNITSRHTADNLDLGSWAAAVAAWSQTAWNGDTGVQILPAHGGDLGDELIQINGGPENDGVIPLTAFVGVVSINFDWQAIITGAGNSLTLSDSFDLFNAVTITGNASGSLSVPSDMGGATWQVVLNAHIQQFGFQLRSDSAAQAGGTARLIITNFTLVVNYTPVSSATVTFVKLPPVPGRTPALQGKRR